MKVVKKIAREMLRRRARMLLWSAKTIGEALMASELRELREQREAASALRARADARADQNEQHRDVWRNYSLTLERYLDATSTGWRDKYTEWVHAHGATDMHQS